VKVVVDIVAGARAGQRLTLDCARPIRFGRAPDNDVAFDAERDRDASGRHAELRRDGDLLWVFDLGSANGTRLHGKSIAKAAVPPGAEIEFGAGGPRVRVQYETPRHEIPAAATRRDGKRVGQRVGTRTVALMIEDALAQARREPRRLRLLLLAMVMLLLVSAGGVVMGYRRLRPPSEAALRHEMLRVMDLERAASDAERLALQRRLDALTAQLGRVGSGADIARANHDNVFLLAARGPSRQIVSLCTAFAVSDTRLVTNAHCVVAAEEQRWRGGRIVVVQNGRGQAPLAVTRMRRVNGFAPGRDAITPDVGWLEVDGNLATHATLATPAEYSALATGDPVFTYGFPGRLADASAPNATLEATFVQGVVGRVTTLDGRANGIADARLIQHSAFTSGGTSGSPIFNAAGHVVAVNTGGYVDRLKTLAGYNFGMRIDMATELLSEADE
jgi:S1-C subfamily serine protease